VSAGDGGQLTMWDLEAQRLIGQMPTAHTGRVTALHFLAGQAVMVSTGGDNAMRTWIFDQPDAMARQLVSDGFSS
jgi:U3 small nucleolar RNA-associated protein 21